MDSLRCDEEAGKEERQGCPKRDEETGWCQWSGPCGFYAELRPVTRLAIYWVGWQTFFEMSQ